MNSQWLKPAVIFVVGLLLGIGGMYLVGVRPQGNLAVCEGIPDVAGLSGKGLVVLNNNQAVTSAQLVVTLMGTIQGIDGNTITIAQGANAPITVKVSDQTSITGEPSQSGTTPVFKFSDLQNYESVRVFGQLKGENVAADNIIRSASTNLQ